MAYEYHPTQRKAEDSRVRRGAIRQTPCGPRRRRAHPHRPEVVDPFEEGRATPAPALAQVPYHLGGRAVYGVFHDEVYVSKRRGFFCSFL